jgi:hypothetical protein
MLLDHFHSPLKDTRPWTGFHSMWATKLATAISRKLPDGWFAAPTVHWGIEVDVAAFEHAQVARGTAGAFPNPVTIPEPTKTISFSLATDVVEVQVFRDLGELTLVGAVEFVSPSNKDRPDSRKAFIAKCDAYLRDSVGLVIMDIVTTRHANLHSDLLARFGEPVDEESHLYVAAYRPFPGETGPALSIWYRALQVGAELPPMLLFLKEGPIVELPFAQTYYETCLDLKIIKT